MMDGYWQVVEGKGLEKPGVFESQTIISANGTRGRWFRRTKLFGRDAALPIGPFILAQVARCEIFPLFIARAGYRRYRIITGKPFTCPRNDRPREEVAGAPERQERRGPADGRGPAGDRFRHRLRQGVAAFHSDFRQ